MSTPESRERARRLKIKASALREHQKAKDPLTGKSVLAMAAGKASARARIDDKAWGVTMAVRRWSPEANDGS